MRSVVSPPPAFFVTEKCTRPFPDVRRGAMIRPPSMKRPFAKVSATTATKKFFITGVDGLQKRCRMGGSPRTKRLGAQTGNGMQAKRSLTVCAGELCGRLAVEGYDLSKQCKRPTK